MPWVVKHEKTRLGKISRVYLLFLFYGPIKSRGTRTHGNEKRSNIYVVFSRVAHVIYYVHFAIKIFICSLYLTYCSRVSVWTINYKMCHWFDILFISNLSPWVRRNCMYATNHSSDSNECFYNVLRTPERWGYRACVMLQIISWKHAHEHNFVVSILYARLFLRAEITQELHISQINTSYVYL